MSPAPAHGRKLVLVLADGLRADTARDYMGYLQALNEAGRARWAQLRCELPSLSRPLYATLITGRRPVDHGIVANGRRAPTSTPSSSPPTGSPSTTPPAG